MPQTPNPKLDKRKGKESKGPEEMKQRGKEVDRLPVASAGYRSIDRTNGAHSLPTSPCAASAAAVCRRTPAVPGTLGVSRTSLAIGVLELRRPRKPGTWTRTR